MKEFFLCIIEDLSVQFRDKFQLVRHVQQKNIISYYIRNSRNMW